MNLIEKVGSVLREMNILGGRKGLCQNKSEEIKKALTGEGYAASKLNGGQHREVLVEDGDDRVMVDGAPLDGSGEIKIKPVSSYIPSGQMPIIDGKPYFKI